MSDSDILLDDLDRIKKQYVPLVIDYLKVMTPEKTQTAVAHAINVLPAAISQMKSGSSFLYKKHLKDFSRLYNLEETELITQLTQYVAGTTPIETSYGNVEHGIEPPTITDAACIIADPKMRDQFLTALQSTLNIPEGSLFRRALNNDPVSSSHTNYQIFVMTGQVPQQWIGAISDPQKRIALIERYSSKQTDLQKEILAQKKDSSPKKQTCVNFGSVPQEFLNAFYHACIAAGKAIHLKLAVEAFLGTLSLNLQHCTVASRPSDTPEILIVTIHNGKLIIEYHLNVSDFS